MNEPGAPDPSGGNAPDDSQSWTPATREYIRQLRSEAASHRTKRQAAEAKVKTLEQSSGPKIRELSIDLALERSDQLAGVEDKNYIKFLLAKDGKLDDLDPDSADFDETLKDRVSDLIGQRPQLRSSRAPTSSSSGSAGMHGAAGATPELTRQDLKAMTPAQVVAALNEGRLNGILGRRG